VPQIQGVKGEAVVIYADPLRTQEMRYHRLSRRVNNSANMITALEHTIGGIVSRTYKQTKLIVIIAFLHALAENPVSKLELNPVSKLEL